MARLHFRALPAWLLLVLLATTAGAAELDLYEVTVPLEDETRAARSTAFTAAMDIVLTRIVGRLDAPRDPVLVELRTGASAYVQQYRAERDELWVAFDGGSLQQALAELNQPIWGGERPQVLLVLAVDQGAGRRFVLSGEDEVADPESQELRDVMLALADLRGLPIVLPLMDAQDRRSLSFTEVWGAFDESLRQAGQRYDVGAVLLGRYDAERPYRVRWTLFDTSDAYRWAGQLADGVHGASDRFASRYSVATEAAVEGEVGLAVSGLDSLSDYGRVLRHLEGVTAIDSVAVRRLQDDTAEFGIRLRGSLDNVDRAIRLGGLLRPGVRTRPLDPQAQDTASDIRPVALNYRLKQ